MTRKPLPPLLQFYDNPDVTVINPFFGGGGAPPVETQVITNTPAAAGATLRTGGYIMGMGFLVNSNITITKLSRWASVADTQIHEVSLWDELTSTMIASVNVNCAGVASDGWVSVAITPVALTAGKTYRLASDELSSIDLPYQQAVYTTDGVITVQVAAFSGGGYPGSNAGGGMIFVPVGFEFTNP